ncbi:hypothetical protein E0H73_41100 [Kribbella pittospori]|uniref:Wadjet protein JetD C-terminal domain-containing protein n=1 Tax=Kribbella pittospori TaxID=722689 RepID=A0A4R0JXW5_9ACTN|nr:Wadjet anti-phage system protein JetD domain-containing protein [Kribbella pittospori]TCC51517.1 hypothetical protein E0H73_41100 [Kribbella pittospori]
MTLTALAQHLAEHVSNAATQRVEVKVLYGAAVAFDRRLATVPTARTEIGEALDELVRAGIVMLPSSPKYFDRRETPPLPMWVRRPPRERQARARREVRVWPAVLEEAGRLASRDDEYAVLEIVAAFLRGGGAEHPSVPARERSLELFGDEKRLDGLAMTRLFTSGALTLELLRCHAVPIPFVSQWVPGRADPRGTALLIAENHHTYTSLLEVIRECAGQGGPGRHVGYGTGSQFPSAVLTVPLLEPRPERIVYFGDIDLKGLQIPAAADLNARGAGLPEVAPALPLYELLFQHAHRRPADRVAPDLAGRASQWLGHLAEHASAALTIGYRLPQEAVGYELLSSHLGILDLV